VAVPVINGNDDSEYGGYPGLIQPEPHDFTDSSTEMLMLSRLTNPSDPASSEETVAAELRKDAEKRLKDK
jgi:hypothetical protein